MLRSKSVIDLLSPASQRLTRDIEQLPVASGEQDVLVAHPALQLVAPGLFFNWEPVVAEATRPIPNAFDHLHRCLTVLSQASLPAPVHHIGRDERSVDKLQLPLTVGRAIGF
jgi:hypothetical protein